MDSTAFPCVRCGARRVTLRESPGRTYSYRVFPALAVPANIGIPTCGRCWAQYIDEQTSARLEPVLAAEYKRELSRRAQRAITDLSPHLAQAALERLIDISQGYLSRINGGHGNPSPQWFCCLPCLPRTLACSNGWSGTGPSPVKYERIAERLGCVV